MNNKEFRRLGLSSCTHRLVSYASPDALSHCKFTLTLTLRMENTRGSTVELCGACRNGNVEVVEEILSNKEVDINGRDYVGNTPLIWAVNSGHLDIVRRLLQHLEVDVNAPGLGGNTPLMIAVYHGHLDIVKTLLEVPALQLGKCSNYGSTALHKACYNEVSIIKVLCEDSRCSPGVVNKKTRNGYTALMVAVIYGQLNIVKELDREGTDFFTKDRYGATLIDMARRRNHDEVLEYLKERNKIVTLKAKAAHKVARYVKNKAEVKALEIPVVVKHFLAGFVNDDEQDKHNKTWSSVSNFNKT